MPKKRTPPAPRQAPAPQLIVVSWPIGRVKRYPGNPRRNEKAVPKVAASIREFGWRQPIVVDPAGVIVVGDTRYQAALLNGDTHVPVNVATGLSPEQLAAYRLADNRASEEASWDDDRLSRELEALSGAGYDLSFTLFDPEEIAAAMSRPTVTPEQADAAAVPPPPKKPTTKPGDRILLGAHVLVCGDATDPSAWRALLGTEKAQGMWTDPPYGVEYVGKTADKLTISNDGHDLVALTNLLRVALGLAKDHLVTGGACFVAGPPGPPFLAFALVLTELGIWRQTLVWVKDRFVLGRQDFHWQHEVVISGYVPEEADPLERNAEQLKEWHSVAYGWKPGAAHTWLGDRRECTVMEVARPGASREHPTMKPVALIDPHLQLTVPAGGIVLDPFAGSGSTLMACETSGRVARCLELSPGYCDVIVARWEEATGQQAVRT